MLECLFVLQLQFNNLGIWFKKMLLEIVDESAVIYRLLLPLVIEKLQLLVICDLYKDES